MRRLLVEDCFRAFVNWKVLLKRFIQEVSFRLCWKFMASMSPRGPSKTLRRKAFSTESETTITYPREARAQACSYRP